ncbi:MAG: alpha/beta hydrolase, partial [Clostridia bacterium]
MKALSKILLEKPLDGADIGVLILPGGGYYNVSEIEAGCVADKFNSLGASAFVLYYSVYPNKFPTALLEVAEAIKHIRQNFSTIKKLIVCGFSAGGHLAGCIATMFDSPIISDALGKFDYRPDGAILCYPVITNDKRYRHNGSFACLCGNFNKKLKEKLSLENCVDDNTPPTFLWHTQEDNCVPCRNSELFAEALAKHNVPCKLQLFPHGGHGLSLASPQYGFAQNRCF